MASFLDGFARFTELWIEGPMQLSNSLEVASGLDPDSMLAANLLVFLLISPLAGWVIARARNAGVLPKVLGFLAFYLWMNIGMGVECRSGVPSGGDGNGGGGGGGAAQKAATVVDVGHQLLTPLYDFAHDPANAVFESVAVTSNTIYVMLIGFYASWLAFVHGKVREIVRFGGRERGDRERRGYSNSGVVVAVPLVIGRREEPCLSCNEQSCTIVVL